MAKSPRGNGLAIRPHQVRANGRLRVGLRGKMDKEAPESTKNLMKLLCLSWRKIEFFAGRKDIGVAEAGTVAGGGGGVI